MTLATYLLCGLMVMLIKFACALVVAKRGADEKARLKKTWTAWGFLAGIVAWPIEALHLAYVLLRGFLSAMLEAA